MSGWEEEGIGPVVLKRVSVVMRGRALMCAVRCGRNGRWPIMGIGGMDGGIIGEDGRVGFCLS